MKDNTDNFPTSDMRLSIFGLSFKISRFTFLLVMGCIVGIVIGGVTVVFRLAALNGEVIFFPYHGSEVERDWWSLAALRRLLMPAGGGLLCGYLLFRVGNFEGTHGVPAILRAVASGKSYFKARMGIPPALAVVTIAMGGSVGPEGPIAEIGSVTASQIGRVAKIPPKLMKPLIGAGVAAGIAAVFNAPIAGVFFAVEVILRNYEIASFTPIAVASVVAAVIAQAALGDQMALSFPTLTISPSELPLFAVLGLLCGLVSILYVRSTVWAHDQFQRLSIPRYLKPALGGLIVGGIGVFYPSIMGEGYDWIRQVMFPDKMADHALWLGEALQGGGQEWGLGIAFLLLLVGLKIIATSVTLGSGNPGGAFAPAIFIGVMGGAAFGMLLERMHWADDSAGYAVMGMAGLIAGALGAPITAIMITLRHGGNASELLLPVMTTVALTAFVMQLVRGLSVYTAGFLRSGIDLDKAREADPLSLVRVQSVYHTSGFEEQLASTPVFEAFERFRDSTARWFVVRGEDGSFVGIVSLHEMRLAIAETELAHLLVLADITDAFLPRLNPEMSLKDALASFSATEAEVLPVFFGGQGGTSDFRGYLSRQDALNAYWDCCETV